MSPAAHGVQGPVLQPASSEQTNTPYDSPAQLLPPTYPDETMTFDPAVTGAAYQSPEMTPLPDPTPLEGAQHPDYMFLPEVENQNDALPVPSVTSLVSFQRRVATFTILPAGAEDLGMTDINLQGTFLFASHPQFSITPGFQTHFLNGPTRTDLPGQLYNARVEFRWMHQFNPRLGVEFALTPGLYSDFHQSGSDAVRIVGRVLGFYGWRPQTQLVFGAVYLDREDIKALPAAGLIHVPNPNTRIELIFPRPRFATRVRSQPGCDTWAYIGGEFGGGSWAIERSGGGREDVVTYGDLRLLLGLEFKNENGPNWVVETAYVFSREVEYKSGVGDFDPGATGMIRAGVTF